MRTPLNTLRNRGFQPSRMIAAVGRLVAWDTFRFFMGRGSRGTSFSRLGPVALGLALVVLFLGWILGSYTTSAGLPASGYVVTVFDGDTVLLQNGEKIRYLGIDAPEIAHAQHGGDCFGQEAKRANELLVLHRQVTLQYDHETRDHYGRLLAYVSLPDGHCANRELLRGGFAHVFRTFEGFSRFDEFVLAQRDALHDRRGMWGNCSVKPERFYLANRGSGVFHRPQCPFARKTSSRNTIRFETRWAALEQGCSPCRRCKP